MQFRLQHLAGVGVMTNWSAPSTRVTSRVIRPFTEAPRGRG